jgi:hypothetical protein
MEKIISRLASLGMFPCVALSHLDDRKSDDLAGSEGIITEPGVALLGS